MAETHPIREYRDRNQLTQEQLAERVGVTAATISRWENGQREPRGDDRRKICAETGITADQIMQAFEQATAEAAQ